MAFRDDYELTDDDFPQKIIDWLDDKKELFVMGWLRIT